MSRGPHRRWLMFVVLSIVIATVVVIATWDVSRPAYAQNWAVPIFIALTPLMVRAAFFREPAGQRWPTTAAIVAGMVAVQALQVALVMTSQMSWREASVVILVAGIIELAAVTHALLRRRPG